MTELQKKDLQYNWHPYTQHKTMNAPIVAIRGRNSTIWDESGNEYLDAIGSWWANPHGHCRPEIVESITKQINTLEHVLFGGFTHPAAIELSEKLLNLLPFMSKVFYTDNGSTAVEVALKMALQYYMNKGENKSSCIAFEGAFHGDTFGAMSTSGISLFSEAYSSILLPVERIPLPNSENWELVKNRFIEIIENQQVYAFIFEPLVLGAAGMKMYEAQYLDELIKIAKEKKVLTIADEVMTGFGRTAKQFAIDYLQNKPDIICLSKALTGGFLPLSATIANKAIFDAFYDDEVNKALFHGHTFMANPAGCAAAIASVELSTSEETKENILRIQQKYQDFLKTLKKYEIVLNTRILGVILAFEIDELENNEYYGELRNRMYRHFMDNYIIARPVGNTIYFLPMFCITNEELDKLFRVTEDLLKKLSCRGK